MVCVVIGASSDGSPVASPAIPTGPRARSGATAKRPERSGGPRQGLAQRARVRGWEWAAMRGGTLAQAIEARRVETSAAWLDAQHESAVPKGCARILTDTDAGPWRRGLHRRVRERERRKGGGAAAERGAAGDARSEGERRRWRSRGVRPKRKGRAAEATRPLEAMRLRRRSAAPGCRAPRPCRRGCR